jgi:hypothetical protein
MSNLDVIKIKAVPVMLDKERNIRFDLNAFAELEEATGRTLTESIDDIGKGSLKTVRVVLWAGLVWEDETLTEQIVGANIGMHNLAEVTEALTQAISAALPPMDDVKNLPEPPTIVPDPA